jgi:hypothetical protein
MKLMAGRKRHSAEDIVRKLRRADELAAEGKTGEEVAAELGVSAATLYNWRRAYGGMDTDAAKELEELREQNSRLKRLWLRPNWKRMPCARWPRENSEPSAKRRAVDMLTTTLSMSEQLACKAVGLARSTYRRLPRAQTPADPDAEMRAWLRGYVTKHPCHGFRNAWAALRYDERREVNKKKVHRLWREEALQVSGRRECCGWTTVRSLFPKRCNSSAMERSVCPTFRPDNHGTTATSNPSTTGCERSASTATTGTVCAHPSLVG